MIGLQQRHGERCKEAGIVGSDALVNAMAVGLVIELWRNSPVEDMHSSRRGPDDAAIFAESTALQDRAVRALRDENRATALIDFERHLLDRTRSWAGTGGKTLKELGYGHLGTYTRHVKDHTNSLLSIDKHTCVDSPLQVYLVNRARAFGQDHKGMPGWSVVVERIGVLLADPAHRAWGGGDRGKRALAEMPPATPPIDKLTKALLSAPFTLPREVLAWLSNHLLFCAAPPYGTSDWGTRGE
ncbi:hypothetical protein [Rhizohabitans arisaemae]|uniref:hypothetical protein n=1 Tax=Rhizohabitans arisaemae TaxID=2720610 RepID=UPI0024B04794|nr:hypothetical protein [Rhizohabitans arisaemae]